MIIVEDDPYFYLQFQVESIDVNHVKNEFVSSLLFFPSKSRNQFHRFYRWMSMDASSDWIRCRKFFLLGKRKRLKLSVNIVCLSLSRMRIGFVTAPIPLWQRLVYHQQVTSLHASSLSQVNKRKQSRDQSNLFSVHLDVHFETV